ncbi:MAG: hypothetical protein RMY29_002465 [Nostoc sp. CreGUA01]|nr:hypothetical protein [Nostoc sp. CreGUA01]
MTFIKTQNAVINTSYVVAVRLDNQTIADEKSVSVLLATLQFLLFSGIPLLITGILDFVNASAGRRQKLEKLERRFPTI